MSGLIRKSTSTSSLLKIAENEASIDLDAPAYAWKDTARVASQVALRVVAASAAHFVAGFVAGEGALVAYGKVANAPFDTAQAQSAGCIAGCVAALYGATQGLGWAKGTTPLRDIGASLLAVTAAGLAFPMGGLLGGHLSAWGAQTFGAAHAAAPDAQAEAMRQSFAEGSERGAFLLAMAGYGACRWALNKAAPKDKEDLLPTRNFVKSSSMPPQTRTWRRRST